MRNIETRLDKVWSKVIKQRGKWCERCGASDKPLDAAHIAGRGSRATRWHLGNGLALCRPCHQWFDIKATEDEKRDLCYKVYHNESHYDDIKRISNEIKKWTTDKLEGRYKKLKSELI